MSKGSWGGPAKGPGNGGVKAEPFTGRVAGNACDDNRDPDEQAYRAERKRLKRTRTIAMEDRLYEVGMGTAETTPVAVAALTKLHAIWNGQPVAHVDMKANVRRSITELSTDELLALAGSGEGEGGTDETDGSEE